MKLRGKCKHLPDKLGGTQGCWLAKGHHGDHSYWIANWRRSPNDARNTRLRLEQERRAKDAARKRNARFLDRQQALYEKMGWGRYSP